MSGESFGERELSMYIFARKPDTKVKVDLTKLVEFAIRNPFFYRDHSVCELIKAAIERKEVCDIGTGTYLDGSYDIDAYVAFNLITIDDMKYLILVKQSDLEPAHEINPIPTIVYRIVKENGKIKREEIYGAENKRVCDYIEENYELPFSWQYKFV